MMAHRAARTLPHLPPPAGTDRDGAMARRRVAGWLGLVSTLLLAACGGGGGGGTSSGGGPGPTGPTPPGVGTVTGQVTFERIPYRTTGSVYALDMGGGVQVPARGVVVELLPGGGGTPLATTVTDANGNYTVSVNAGTSVQLRVRAKLTEASANPSYTITVVDNTSNNAPYVWDGTTFAAAAGTTTRNVSFAAGWDAATGAYVDANRAAAPFAILDTLYKAVATIRAADPALVFPALTIHWSTRNKPVNTPFQVSSGNLGTTFYSSEASGTGADALGAGIYVLGDAATDTDEFDEAVIAHEFGHYYQDKFSRDESLGGEHALGDRLDFRVAFSEGWGNAFSGMMRASSVYKDSAKPGTTQGFGFDMERNDLDDSTGATGWFAEGSVQEILWDLYDSSAGESGDTVALGFGPIHAVMKGGFRQTPALATVFPFLTAVRSANAANATGIDALAQASGITMVGIDDWGSTETNNGGRADHLPVYRSYSLNGGPVTVASTNDTVGTVKLYNGLGGRRFFRLNLPTAGTVSIRVAGPAGADADFYLFKGAAGLVEYGGCPAETTSPDGCSGKPTEVETWSKSLAAGEYVVEVLDFNRIDDTASPAPALGDTPITLTVTQP